MPNKYRYTLVIQQFYAAAYGWEDVSEYETSSNYMTDPDKKGMVNYDLWRHDVKEYRLTGYPTRTIRRRERL